MGHNDHIDFDLYHAVEQLIEEGDIQPDAPAYGIAQQVIHQGYDSLSDRQRFLYERDISPALIKRAKQNRINEIMNSAPD